MLVARSSAPKEPGGATSEDFLVRSPALEGAARKATDLPSKIRVRKYGSVKVGAVCAPGSCAQASICIEALCASKDVPQHDVQVCTSFRAAGLSAGLDSVSASFPCADEDCMVGRCGRRVCLVGRVDVGADGPVEDVESVKLVHGAADLGKSFLKGVRGVAVVGENGVEDALKEGGASVRCADHADGRDGHWLGGVEADLGMSEGIPLMLCPMHDVRSQPVDALRDHTGSVPSH